MRRRSGRDMVIVLISITLLSISIIYIYKNFLWYDIFLILTRADLLYLIAYGTISIIAYWLLRTMRWFLLLKNLNLNISFSKLYICNAISLGFAILTPFQSGEVLKIELLKKYEDTERISGYGSFAVERAIDVLVLTAMASISILSIIDKGVNLIILIYLWGLILLLLMALLLSLRKFQIHGKLGDFVSSMRLCINDLKNLFVVVILTICSWMMVVFGWKICLESISIDIGLHKSMALTSMATIINTASLIPGALGISEVSITEILINFGLSPASSQAGSLAIRLYGFLIIFLSVIHIFAWSLVRACKVK